MRSNDEQGDRLCCSQLGTVRVNMPSEAQQREINFIEFVWVTVKENVKEDFCRTRGSKITRIAKFVD